MLSRRPVRLKMELEISLNTLLKFPPTAITQHAKSSVWVVGSVDLKADSAAWVPRKFAMHALQKLKIQDEERGSRTTSSREDVFVWIYGRGVGVFQW